MGGVEQFIHLYHAYKGRSNDSFKWGDELEYLLLCLPKNEKTVNLSLRSAEIMSQCKSGKEVIIHPEYGSFMIEATPFEPYGDSHCDLLLVESNMHRRRQIIEAALKSDECLSTMTTYPMMGVDVDRNLVNGPIARSDLISDAVINPHPRFGALTQIFGCAEDAKLIFMFHCIVICILRAMRIRFLWMQWHLEWAHAAFNAHINVEQLMKRGICMTSWRCLRRL